MISATHNRFGAKPRTLQARTDRVDTHGKVTIRYAGHIRHLGIGKRYTGLRILMLIHDREVTVSSLETGDIIGEYLIDPTRDYQARKA